MMLFKNIKYKCLFDNEHNDWILIINIILYENNKLKRKKFFVYENFMF